MNISQAPSAHDLQRVQSDLDRPKELKPRYFEIEKSILFERVPFLHDPKYSIIII